MKLAIVITGMSFGGAERVTAYLSNYFVEQNVNVTIISLTKTVPAYSLSEDIRYIWYDASGHKSAIVRDFSLMRSIRKTISELKPDLVMGMMSYSGTLAAYACIGLPVPVLLSERNDPNTSIAFKEIEKRIIKFAYRHLADNAIFQTLGAKEYYYGDAGRGFIIPNPLYLEAMPQPKETYNESKKIVSAGRLSRQKQYALLIEAFQKVHVLHPDYTLAIYGEGEEREKLEHLIDSLSLQDSVSLPGIEEHIFTKLQEAQMFVLPSLYEGMPNALIEAMAMGLPVITTDYSEGRGTIVEHERNGLVVPRNNADAMCEAMLYFIDNLEEAKRMGKQAVTIRETLDSNRVCKLWMQAITTCVEAYQR